MVQSEALQDQFLDEKRVIHRFSFECLDIYTLKKGEKIYFFPFFRMI